MNINFKIIIVVILIFISVSIQADGTINPGVNFLKSAVVPGWGQLSLDKNYGYGFLLAEASFWTMRFYYLQETDNNAQASYNYARQFADVDPQGHFPNQFYEDMRNYSSSGYNTGGYNAHIVADAVDQYPDDPLAQQAYIEANVYDEAHYWNWSSDYNQSEYSDYRRNIDLYKDYLKLVGGVIAANHIIGAIDALRLSNHLKHVRFGVDTNSDHVPLLTCTVKFK
ncbi:MAG: hypothetical protein RAO94_10540 [Candidatus Stygibacter australis]|nr:hypothetical protein [Candidatus Stygibacter australis]MDP8322775.1 hypothetical protein [Candidatus Stygibacter australis]